MSRRSPADLRKMSTQQGSTIQGRYVAEALVRAADDMERLDWLVRNRAYMVMGDDQRGWMVMDQSNGLSILTRDHKTYRGAIDAARIKLKEKEAK